MTYLPELRASLVEAARHRSANAAEPLERHRPRRWLTAGGVGTALAAATAVAVAAVAIVALGNRRPSTRSAAGPAVTRVTRTDLQVAAARALGGLVLPSDAVRSGLVRGTPAALRSVSSQLSIPGRVDVYRVWRLRDTPDRVISFIERHPPAGSSVGFGGSTEAGSSRPGGPVVVQQASTTIGFPGTEAGIWRELALDAVALPTGGTALRVDSEAGWLMPRPASERIPSGVVQVKVQWGSPSHPQHLFQTVSKLRPVNLLVSLFNSLPSARPGAGICKSGPSGVVRFVFEGSDQNAPLAVASWAPGCPNAGLAIGRSPVIPLMASSPTMPQGAQIAETLAAVLPPRRVSSTDVNSSQGCASSTSSTSAPSPSAPGAAAGSCTSGSRSTTSATSR